MATAARLPEEDGGGAGVCGGAGARARLDARAAWLEAEFLPHRRWLRAWVQQRFPREADLDDIVQESFERILVLADPGEIRDARAYLGRTAYGLVVSRVRRRRIVQIDYHDDLGELGLVCAYPLPDAACAAREEWERAVAAFETLPERTQEVIRLRRVEGASQRETARAVGVSESAIEKHLRRGLRLVRAEVEGGQVGDVEGDAVVDAGSDVGSNATVGRDLGREDCADMDAVDRAADASC